MPGSSIKLIIAFPTVLFPDPDSPTKPSISPFSTLLFSIFELNPAPFCLLDEVDAPLDDTNVSRFCEIVREMSSNVQFVVITHNKKTMELTKQLIGVTMSEPGVSRLVSVDLDEAIELSETTELS